MKKLTMYLKKLCGRKESIEAKKERIRMQIYPHFIHSQYSECCIDPMETWVEYLATGEIPNKKPLL